MLVALQRAVFDDDACIVELVVRKVYAQPGREAARIEVREWVPQLAGIVLAEPPSLPEFAELARHAAESR
jgi:hypothetical protein